MHRATVLRRLCGIALIVFASASLPGCGVMAVGGAVVGTTVGAGKVAVKGTTGAVKLTARGVSTTARGVHRVVTPAEREADY